MASLRQIKFNSILEFRNVISLVLGAAKPHLYVYFLFIIYFNWFPLPEFAQLCTNCNLRLFWIYE